VEAIVAALQFARYFELIVTRATIFAMRWNVTWVTLGTVGDAVEPARQCLDSTLH
jgi:hypothetical protein